MPGQLSITPTPLNFGDVPVGTTQTQSITMSASGATVTVTSDSSSNSQFVLDGVTLPLTIGAGQKLIVQRSFHSKKQRRTIWFSVVFQQRFQLAGNRISERDRHGGSIQRQSTLELELRCGRLQCLSQHQRERNL